MTSRANSRLSGHVYHFICANKCHSLDSDFHRASCDLYNQRSGHKPLDLLTRDHNYGDQHASATDRYTNADADDLDDFAAIYIRDDDIHNYRIELHHYSSREYRDIDIHLTRADHDSVDPTGVDCYLNLR